YGEKLFSRLREADPNFVFNSKKYQGATILISKANFGCGSSREHAVWALQEAGIKAVLAISFGDIFYSNAAKNGLLLIKLDEILINNMLLKAVAADYSLTIDIQNQIISDQDQQLAFEIDAYKKYCFMNGFDDLDYLLNYKHAIQN